MKNIFLGIISVGILAVSCKKDEKPTYIKDEAGVQQSATTVNNAPQPSLLNQAGIPTVSPNSQNVATAPGMNPPHGQPGHKCEIPVGQPLNGSPAPAATPANQNITVNGNNSVQIDPNAVSPGKIMVDQNGKQVKTAPGMNPPHGEPGHRCDIPVGQALNSKPSPAAQPAAQTAQVQAPQPAPVTQAVANNTGPKPKLNPAHGEPWHDCAKKVGDAL
ncbi:hypothetical protein CHRY9390_01240 [Chryseobacterium aquaeductus]|uniref:Uncharacterized protein n=1 Tax=Chryseobacterium aquaeductus TaxID=2675056 RepID=A0A9N8QS20_9FLAO|nr:hypothetical protein [Chryseobacterium aquaeductus]CAA7330569.1 hypothetical protein CHRY9390_01240 [Chryseobacterium potabilaquae]CAD7804553.1 hypothetical protein CHRY9390_01240 [Chryseobacterium aquaeductus]